MTDEREQSTIAYYDREAANWVAAHGGADRPSSWQKEVERFCALLPAGRVLEIGPGAGREAALLIAHGYDYTGIDASESMLAMARRKNPGARFLRRAVHEIDDALGRFDGFWAAAVLLHIPKAGMEPALRALRRILRSQGIGFITLKQGEGEEVDTGTGRWFAYYRHDELSDILKRTGFTALESTIQPKGKDTWLVFFVQAQADAPPPHTSGETTP